MTAKRSKADGNSALRLAVAAMPEACVVVSARGTVLQLNLAAERLLRIAEREAQGKPVDRIILRQHPGDTGGSLAQDILLNQVGPFGTPLNASAKLPDGSLVPLEMVLGQIETADGSAIILSIRDIAERIASQEEAARLQRELTHMTRLSSMGEMAAALAHEINQPLTAIAAHAETARLLLERGSEPKALGAELGQIRDEAVRAGEVIRRIRQLAMRGDGDRNTENLNAVVRDAAALALLGVRNLGIEPEVRLAHEPVPVVCDRIQIQQVVINLVRNAIDALTDMVPADAPVTEPKRVEVNVQKRGDQAFVTVRDSGPGVPEPVRTRLFEAFTTTKHNGMGIGLSISRTIAEAHGGELTLEPATAKGAAFRLRLPLATA